jgi:hypothetical protein
MIRLTDRPATIDDHDRMTRFRRAPSRCCSGWSAAHNQNVEQIQ